MVRSRKHPLGGLDGSSKWALALLVVIDERSQPQGLHGEAIRGRGCCEMLHEHWHLWNLIVRLVILLTPVMVRIFCF